MPTFYALCIALLGLIAPWAKCLDEKPAPHRWPHRIPLIGKLASRIRLMGFVYIALILLFTALSIRSSDQAQAQMDSRLEALQTATDDIKKIGADQQQALNGSIDRLGTVKQQVDSIAKQGELLSQTAADTAQTLKQGNRSLADAQEKLANSIEKGNTDIKGAEAELSSSLAKITVQINAQYQESLAKQIDAISRITDADKKVEATRQLITEYIHDEMSTDLQITLIKLMQKNLDQTIEAYISYFNQNPTNNAVKNFNFRAGFGLYLSFLRTSAPATPKNVVENQFASIAKSLPANDWPISAKDKANLINAAEGLKITLDGECDISIVSLQSRRIPNLFTLPATQPAIQSQTTTQSK